MLNSTDGNPAGTVFFMGTNPGSVPNRSGIYGIYSTRLFVNARTELYVGRSNDLQRRFGEHQSNKKFLAEMGRHLSLGDQVKFEWWMMWGEWSIQRAELNLIRRRDPLMNKTGNKMDTSWRR